MKKLSTLILSGTILLSAAFAQTPSGSSMGNSTMGRGVNSNTSTDSTNATNSSTTKTKTTDSAKKQQRMQEDEPRVQDPEYLKAEEEEKEKE